MPFDLTKIYLFRIMHINNLEHVLTHGISTRNHSFADADYINIGDSGLIAQRNDYPVKINPPNGFLGEYVPFYFGPLSPMLLNIKTGYRGITKRPQEEIVYICCRLTGIIENCRQWCFTDGHAKTAITEFYNNIDFLSEIDWEMVKERYWSPTEDDFDRMRRKQAEFLVKGHVPVNCINLIITLNDQRKAQIEEILERLNLKIQIFVDHKYKFYY